MWMMLGPHAAMSDCKMFAALPMPCSCVGPTTLMVNGFTLSIVLEVGRVTPGERAAVGHKPCNTAKVV